MKFTLIRSATTYLKMFKKLSCKLGRENQLLVIGELRFIRLAVQRCRIALTDPTEPTASPVRAGYPVNSLLRRLSR
jgi:hypothetical protein